MIRIGLTANKKQYEINEYLVRNEINKIFVFYPSRYHLIVDTNVQIEHIEYNDIIMYKFFYRLLEVIDNHTLLIFNECLRTQNRSELTYNCAHHYCNQTPHKIIFEFFPIIDTKSDLMILLDLENKGKYKGKSFDYIFLQNEDIKIKPFKIKLETINVAITEKDHERYDKKKEQLFDNLGSKDPDTIPRNLQIFSGDLKKKAIDPDKNYISRNKRFKMDNVKSYQEITGKGDYIIIDMHHRRLNFNDFLKTTNMNKVKYLSTVLSIDSVVINEFVKWQARLEAIYAQASLYK